jgi:hypothetical protein
MTDKVSIVVCDVEDHEDGSATIHFEVEERHTKVLASIGIEFVLHCAALKVDTSVALGMIANLIESKKETESDGTPTQTVSL